VVTSATAPIEVTIDEGLHMGRNLPFLLSRERKLPVRLSE
jgi:hypothetical protein